MAAGYGGWGKTIRNNGWLTALAQTAKMKKDRGAAGGTGRGQTGQHSRKADGDHGMGVRRFCGRAALLFTSALLSVCLLSACARGRQDEERARRLAAQAGVLPMYLPAEGEQINAETIFYYLVHVGFLYAEENGVELAADQAADWLYGMPAAYLQKMAGLVLGAENLDFSACMEPGALRAAGGGIADYYAPREQTFYVSRPQVQQKDAPYDLDGLQVRFEGEQAVLSAAFAALSEAQWIEYRFDCVLEGELEYYRLCSWEYR